VGDSWDDNAFEVTEYGTNLSIEQTLKLRLKNINGALEDSDIDLVIYAKHNRIWFNRLLLNIAAGAVGRRRGKKKRADRFCFNASLSDGSSFKLQSLYPSAILIKKNSDSMIILRTRKTFEYLLEITFFAPVLEHISKYFLTTYIHSRFRHFKSQKDRVLMLKNSRIIYHPPVVEKM